MPIYCSNCGIELPNGVSFCDACGTPVRGQAQGQGPQQHQGSPVPSGGASIGLAACPVCGASALPGEAFCDNCGAALLSSAGPSPSSTSHVSMGSAEAQPPTSHVPQPPAYSSAPMSGNVAGPSRQMHASLVVTVPPPPATIPVPDITELIVGRADPQSNSYPDVDLGPYGGLELGVSRRHFRLRTGDQFYLEDLNAMNGTMVNGQRLSPFSLHPLQSGDRISLGKMELRFELA